MAGKLDYIQMEPMEVIQALVADSFNALNNYININWADIYSDMYSNIYKNVGIVEIISFDIQEE